MNALSVALIPRPLAILLNPRLAAEIAEASAYAEQRLTAREDGAEQAAVALQWLQSEANVHVSLCRPCRFRACRTLRSLRRSMNRASQRYAEALKRLRGGR